VLGEVVADAVVRKAGKRLLSKNEEEEE